MKIKTNPRIWYSPAKINLFLHIINKRVDGYHNLETVFVLLDYYDTLTFNISNDGIISRLGDNNGILEEQDLIIRCAKLLQRYSKTKLGARISITKKIPIGSGLGGGSSNCSTSLLALNKLWGINAPLDKLAKLGKELGADVPVFIYTSSAWAEGIGDKLSPIKIAKYYFLVVCPKINANTKKVFSHKKIRFRQTITKITNINNLDNTLVNTDNGCLEASCDLYPEILKVIAWFCLFTNSAVSKPRLSGTGCSVFVYSKNKNELENINSKCPTKWLSFIAENLTL